MTIRRTHRSALRRTAIGAVIAGMFLAVTGVAMNPAQAANQDPGPPGNNGTVKIDGLGLNDGPGHSQKPNDPLDEGTDNDPHVTCGFQLEFFNFDTGQRADIELTAHAPTGKNGVLLFENVEISDDGTGGAALDPDLMRDYSVDDFDQSQFTSVHPVHGWHVKLNVTLYDSEGDPVRGGDKHKVFWVEPCEEEEEFGGLTVDKVVAGTGTPASNTEFDFTLDCTLNETPVDLNGEDAGTQYAFSLTAGDDPESFSFLPPGAECTIAETDAQGADSTSWTVDGDAATAPVEVTIVANTTIAVVATNTFNTRGSTTGSLSVAKATSGNDQPVGNPAYSFSVSCTSGGNPVDLNGDASGNDATFTRTSGQAAHVLSGIPTGAVCSVTETDDQNADSTGWTVNGSSVADGSSVSNLTIGNGTTVAVVATNRFNTTISTPTFGGLSVDKDVAGDDTPPVGTAFSFTVDCLDGSTPADLNGPSAGTQASFTLTAGQAARVLSGIPTGSACTVTETDAQDADSTTVTIGTGTAAVGTSASGVTIGNGTTVPVLFTNTYNADVAGVVVTPPNPPANPPTKVAGEVITRPAALARTGTTTLPLLQAGLGLILLGVGALIFGRERTALI